MCSTCLFQQANKNCCGTVSRAYVFQLCGNSRLGPGRLCMRWVCRGHYRPHDATFPCSGTDSAHAHTQYTHTHTRLTALYPGLPRWAGTRMVKSIWILLKQETASGSGISWAICKSAPHSRQITTPAPHHSVFTGRMPFLPPNQQRQSTEGNYTQ